MIGLPIHLMQLLRIMLRKTPFGGLKLGKTINDNLRLDTSWMQDLRIPKSVDHFMIIITTAFVFSAKYRQRTCDQALYSLKCMLFIFLFLSEDNKYTKIDLILFNCFTQFCFRKYLDLSIDHVIKYIL